MRNRMVISDCHHRGAPTGYRHTLPTNTLREAVFVGAPTEIRDHLYMDITAMVDMSTVTDTTRSKLATALKTGVLPAERGKAAYLLNLLLSGSHLGMLWYSAATDFGRTTFRDKKLLDTLEAYARVANSDRTPCISDRGYVVSLSNLKLPMKLIRTVVAEHGLDEAWHVQAEPLLKAVTDKAVLTIQGGYHDARYSYDYR